MTTSGEKPPGSEESSQPGSPRSGSPQQTLERWKDSEVKAVRIVGPAPLSNCAVCRYASGTVYSLETALRERPLPHERCRMEGTCCCTYSPLYERPGRLARPGLSVGAGVSFFGDALADAAVAGAVARSQEPARKNGGVRNGSRLSSGSRLSRPSPKDEDKDDRGVRTSQNGTPRGKEDYS